MQDNSFFKAPKPIFIAFCFDDVVVVFNQKTKRLQYTLKKIKEKNPGVLFFVGLIQTCSCMLTYKAFYDFEAQQDEDPHLRRVTLFMSLKWMGPVGR